MQRIALLLAAVLGLGSLAFVLLQSRGPMETVDAVPLGSGGLSEEAAIPDLAVGKADHQGERQSALPAAVASNKPESESAALADSFVRGEFRARNRNGGECFITGRLVDPRGEPVSDVSLSSVDDVLGPSQRLPTDGGGRFSGRVWALDEATLIFTKANVGQSEPMDVVTNAAPVLDLGTIWLIEEGTIEGRVQLADGTPVPSVKVAGTTRNRGSSGGLDATITRTRDDGGFTLSVPFRRFQLAPPKDQLLEFKRVLGGRIDLTFATGPEFRGWMPCTVRIKEEEEPDSSYRSFARVSFPPRGLGQVSVAPGRTVQSRAFPPGRYTIHLQSDGHLTAIANAEIKPGKVTAVEVALEANPAAAPEK